jgi:transposase
MHAETRIAALEAEDARLRAEVAAAHETITTLSAQVTALSERVKELEGQQATDSHNNSKPPSSDGPRRVPRSLRGTSGKKPGGQPEYPGTSLRLVDTPDRRVEGRQVIAAPVCTHVIEYQRLAVRGQGWWLHTASTRGPAVNGHNYYGVASDRAYAQIEEAS